MNNLLNFFWKYHVTFLFIFLEAVAFALLVNSNRFHKANFLGFSGEVSGSIYSSVKNITDYFELRRTNEQLAGENARLITLTKNSFIKINRSFLIIDDTLYKQQYKYQSAKVLNSSTNRRNNFLILDHGGDQGVEPGMGVICTDGVVGVVNKVSKNFCSVISLLHKETKISARLKKNDYFGIVTWEGGDFEFGSLSDIPRHVELRKGDTVITRSSSGIFPEGVLVGFAEEFEVPPGENFYNIKLHLSTGFNRLTHVYIVKNILRDEQMLLEADFDEK